jgi:uracil-DNA glycosylase
MTSKQEPYEEESYEYTYEAMTKDVKPSWMKYINGEKDKPYFKKLLEYLNDEVQDYYVYPFPENVFETLKYFELNETKMLFVSQDPYIRSTTIDDYVVPQAMGLSFSVPKGVKTPPSLVNIYKEISTTYDDFEIPDHGDLSRWVKEENILLLNAALTVREGKSGSHQKLWDKFTDGLIQYISQNTEGVVFLLLGNFAKKKAKFIRSKKHGKVTGTHPSPLAAHKGFFGSEVFSEVNELLMDEFGKEPIDWRVD